MVPPRGTKRGSARGPKRAPVAGQPRSGDARGRTRRRRRARPAGSAVRAGQPADARGERLQKVLAAAGKGSRRQCEELIRTGRVEVDRQVLTELGTRVDPTRQEIRVDGELLARGRRVYFAVNKPPGVLSTNRDPEGRLRVIDLVPEGRERIYTVGRLDKSSEGLLLVTNDGDLAHRLTHPRYGVTKRYQVLVAGVPSDDVLAQLERGIFLAEGVAHALHARLKLAQKQSAWLELDLQEGRNREIRRLLARVGHKVLRLRRVAIGPLRIGDLPVGAHRRLRSDEVEELRRATLAEGSPSELPLATSVPSERERAASQRGGRAHLRGGRSKAKRSRPAGGNRPAREKVRPAKETARPASQSGLSMGKSGPPGGKPGRPAGRTARPTGKPAGSTGKLRRPTGKSGRVAGQGSRAAGQGSRAAGQAEPARTLIGAPPADATSIDVPDSSNRPERKPARALHKKGVARPGGTPRRPAAAGKPARPGGKPRRPTAAGKPARPGGKPPTARKPRKRK